MVSPPQTSYPSAAASTSTSRPPLPPLPPSIHKVATANEQYAQREGSPRRQYPAHLDLYAQSRDVERAALPSPTFASGSNSGVDTRHSPSLSDRTHGQPSPTTAFTPNYGHGQNSSSLSSPTQSRRPSLGPPQSASSSPVHSRRPSLGGSNRQQAFATIPLTPSHGYHYSLPSFSLQEPNEPGGAGPDSVSTYDATRAMYPQNMAHTRSSQSSNSSYSQTTEASTYPNNRNSGVPMSQGFSNPPAWHERYIANGPMERSRSTERRDRAHQGGMQASVSPKLPSQPRDAVESEMQPRNDVLEKAPSVHPSLHSRQGSLQSLSTDETGRDLRTSRKASQASVKTPKLPRRQSSFAISPSRQPVAIGISSRVESNRQSPTSPREPRSPTNRVFREDAKQSPPAGHALQKSLSSTSDLSDYGSQADDKRDYQIESESVSPQGGEHVGAERLSGAFQAVLQLASEPPKLKRPSRAMSISLETPRPSLTAAPFSDEPVDPAVSRPLQPRGLSVSSTGTAPSRPDRRSPRKVDDVPLVNVEGPEAVSPETSREIERPEEIDEAAIEAAALRAADLDDPNRPKTLREARELAKARAQARKEAARGDGPAVESSPATQQATSIARLAVKAGEPSPVLGHPGRRRELSLSSQRGGTPESTGASSELAGHVPGFYDWRGGKDVEPSNLSRHAALEASTSSSGSAMDELHAAIGHAMEDMSFGTVTTGDSTDRSRATATGDKSAASRLRSSSRVAESEGSPAYESVRSSVELPFDSASEQSHYPDEGETNTSSAAVDGLEEPDGNYSDDESDPASRRRTAVQSKEALLDASESQGELQPHGVELADDQALSASQGDEPQSLAEAVGEPLSPTTPMAPNFNQGLERFATPQVPQSTYLAPFTPTQPSAPQPPPRPSVQIVEPHQKLLVPGKTTSFPPAFDFLAISVAKRKQAPWERARTYAKFTNELAATPSGLALWMQTVQHGPTKQRQAARSVSSAASTRFPTSTSGLSQGQVFGNHPRDFSGASARSDATFPRRGDGARARDVTAIPVDPSQPETMPDAVPANIPYPTLARLQPNRAPSSASATTMSDQISPVSTLGRSAGSTSPTKERANTAMTSSLSSYSMSPSHSVGSQASVVKSSQSHQTGLSSGGLSSGKEVNNRAAFLGSLARRNSKRAAPGGGVGLSPSVSSSGSHQTSITPSYSTSSVHGPRAPGVPAGSALARTQAYASARAASPGGAGGGGGGGGGGYGSGSSASFDSSVRGGSMDASQEQPRGRESESEWLSSRSGSASTQAHPPVTLGRLGSFQQGVNVGSVGGGGGGSGGAPGSLTPSASQRSLTPSGPRSLLPSSQQPDLRSASSNASMMGGGGVSGATPAAATATATANPAMKPTDGPGSLAFESTLRKMADVLPDADEDVLRGYLLRAGGPDEVRAIGEYLNDKALGNLKAPGSRR